MPEKAKPMARLATITVGAVWVVLTIPALAVASMSLLAIGPGVTLMSDILVYACCALPALTMHAGIGCFKTAKQPSLGSVARSSAGPFISVAIGWAAAVAYGL